MTWHKEVLSARQKKALVQLAPVMTARSFYLAGGTAAALQLGHRQSVDLDWFTVQAIRDGLSLAQELRVDGVPLTVGHTDRGTLHATVANVRTSFLEFRYPMLHPLIEWEDYHCRVASLDDLACMKLSAIAQRGAKKDFIDLYALVSKHKPLPDLVSLYRRKFSIRDATPVVLGLCYFDDAEKERMPRMHWRVSWKTVKLTIQRWSRDLTA